jgi:hypothetical protein
VSFLRRVFRAAKLVARDPRIPRPLKWLAALGVLPVPGPFDEAVLVVVAALLFAFKRDVVREAWHAAR